MGIVDRLIWVVALALISVLEVIGTVVIFVEPGRSRLWLVAGPFVLHLAARQVVLLTATIIPLMVVGATLILARSRYRLILAAWFLVVLALTSVIFTIVTPAGSPLFAKVIPDPILYASHATLATLLNRLGHPHAAAIQWAKATSHAQNGDEVVRATQGFTALRAQDSQWIDAFLCRQSRSGVPQEQEIARQLVPDCA